MKPTLTIFASLLLLALSGCNKRIAPGHVGFLERTTSDRIDPTSEVRTASAESAA